ncbi:MAG: fluoride efflux transporter CrcB [Proteobacteria bacterium]|nr:fluoride efflux transporter CrcB [Pseudomonadota bacterium]
MSGLAGVSAAGFAAVGIGAALGAWLRWMLGLALNHIVPALPLGTLVANLVGGYLIGIAIGVIDHAGGLSPETRLFVITGFLGGLTTFSTFSAESVALLQGGRYDLMLLHIFSHLAGSLLLTLCGLWTVRTLLH